MGCDHYRINNTTLHFGENDTIGCLCTFPYNYGDLSKIDKITVYKLALLGAAVKFVHMDYLEQDDSQEYWFYIPDEIPKELQDRIQALLGGIDPRPEEDDDYGV